MADLRVALKSSERAALIKLARGERREPRDQAALILVRELERRGLLPTTPPEEPRRRREPAHGAPIA